MTVHCTSTVLFNPTNGSQARSAINYEPAFDESVAAQAKAAGRDAEEFFYDRLLGDEGPATSPRSTAVP